MVVRNIHHHGQSHGRPHKGKQTMRRDRKLRSARTHIPPAYVMYPRAARTQTDPNSLSTIATICWTMPVTPLRSPPLPICSVCGVIYQSLGQRGSLCIACDDRDVRIGVREGNVVMIFSVCGRFGGEVTRRQVHHTIHGRLVRGEGWAAYLREDAGTAPVPLTG